jgi:hypothetical protein
METPGRYVDETVMRMCKGYRSQLFGELAAKLIEEGKPDKALAVLDKGMQVLPVENVPCDYSAFMIGELYLTLGQKEKGEQIMNRIADYSMRSIRWYFNLREGLWALPEVQDQLRRDLAIVHNVLAVGIRNNPDFGIDFRDEFNNYRMAYTQQPDGNK